jgi:hypothetical protein
VRDVIVTAVVAVVLALVFMYVLLAWLFSGWGDPPTGTESPTSGVSVSSSALVVP